MEWSEMEWDWCGMWLGGDGMVWDWDGSGWGEDRVERGSVGEWWIGLSMD